MDQFREKQLEATLTAAPMVPVLTIEDRKVAVPLGRALVAGGLTALEVTLRTPAAFDCIRAMIAEVEGATVGAGTVRTARQYEEAEKAGAKFVVSPGATPGLIAAGKASAVPFLPGIITPGEAMTLAEEGFTTLKFFPAEPAGGVAYLRALAAPLAGIRFCPTGNITQKLSPSYLALPNVICIGGTWVTPPDALAAADWPRITGLSREAAALKGE
jgi:2-dehydro-3-deoxyphosphogluconate aldolase/(4S)-4-hydroxy-2-oxoglutarate aldolase